LLQNKCIAPSAKLLGDTEKQGFSVCSSQEV